MCWRVRARAVHRARRECQRAASARSGVEEGSSGGDVAQGGAGLTLEGALDVETLHARLRRRMRHSMHVLMQQRNPDSYYSEVVHLEPT